MPDALLRPACEAALQAARAGQVAVPAAPVPPPLRPLLRFARLNGAAMATVRRVLDEDEGFRRQVCEALDLPAARDELGAASVLFLERPEGWQAELDGLAAAAAEVAAEDGAKRAEALAARRLEVVEVALARAEAELGSLRADVALWRDKAAAERRGRRMAESDVGRLRKRLAEVERAAGDEVAAAATGAADAPAWTAAVAAAEDRAARAEAAAEEARAEASQARAARAAEPDPPPVPPGPAVDHAAVADAVSAAVAAVGSLADALARAADALASGPVPAPGGSWPPPDPTPPVFHERRRRPRPPVGQAAARVPEPLPPAVFDDEVAAAEHLLRVPGVLVLVDGYNVTLTARGWSSLPDQRRWLLDAAAGVALRTGAEFLVVFDGDAEGGPQVDGSRRRGVQVRFTAADVEADDVVLERLASLPPDRPAVVVSDDHRVRDGARRLGANVVGVDQLVAALRR